MRASIFLLIAGLLDAVLTQAGITFGIIEERNPAIKFVIKKSWPPFFLIKVSLPVVLLGIILYRPLNGWIKGLMYSSCMVYFLILAIHFTWIVFYFKSIA